MGHRRLPGPDPISAAEPPQRAEPPERTEQAEGVVRLVPGTIGPGLLPRFALAGRPVGRAATGRKAGGDRADTPWAAIEQRVSAAAQASTLHRYRVDRGHDAGSLIVVVSGGVGTASVVLEPSFALGPVAADAGVLALVAGDHLAVLAMTGPGRESSSHPDRRAAIDDQGRSLAARLRRLAAAGTVTEGHPPVLRCSGRGRFAIFDPERGAPLGGPTRVTDRLA